MRVFKSKPFLVFVIVLTAALSAFADRFVIAPHLQNVTQDGATLIWETQDAGTGEVAYGPEGSPGSVAKDTQAGTIHRVRLTGLHPDTAYAYRVRAGSEERANTFKTAPSSERAIAFAVVGDSRRWENRWQETHMAAHMMQWHPEFCINNGDLVLEGHKHDLWPEHFARFADFNGSIMMMSARGNHEGSRMADTDNDWFAKYHEMPGAGEPFATFDWGNTHFVLVSMDKVSEASEQLDKDLAGVTKKYTVVVFHYPVYCTGYASPDDSRKDDGEKLSAIWKVMDKYHVPLHLSGHTHIFERTWPLHDGKRDDRQGTTYVIQGGDINANYPDWWSAVTDDRATEAKPTYTLIWCKDDQIEMKTFAWGTQANAVVEVDHCIICRDEAIPAALLAGLPGKKGQDLLADIDTLGATMYVPAAKSLLAYLKDSDPAIRGAASAALRSIGSGEVAQDLAPYLGDASVAVRRNVARALEIAMPESLAKTVAAQVRDSAQDETVRVSLLGALQFHAPRKLAYETAADVLKGDAPRDVRNRAAYALSRVADQGDAKALAKLVDKETEPYAVQRLAYALNRLTGKHVGLGDKQPLARAKPGERGEFVRVWLDK